MRLVVRMPNWLGDIVMALPAFTAIRAQFAADSVAVAVPAALAPVVTAVSGVDAVVALRGRPHATSLGSLTDDARVLADGGFQVAILLPNSFASALAAWRAGIPERWGYRAGFRGWLLTRAVPRPRRRRLVHHSEYYLDLLRGLGMDAPARNAPLQVPPDVQAAARARLQRAGIDPASRLIGLAPGAAYGHAKRWPAERFAELILTLRGTLDVTCLLLGSTGDRDAGHAIESWRPPAAMRSQARQSLGPRVINLIGQTDLLELMGVMSLCRAFVSNDSGAMHLAAALGVPVVAVFGPTDERATAPLGPHQILTNPVWCRPCLLRECPIDHRCMTGISVGAVCEAVLHQVAVAS